MCKTQLRTCCQALTPCLVPVSLPVFPPVSLTVSLTVPRHALLLSHRSIDELIGRADLLRQRKVPLAKTAGLDLSYLTTFAGPSGKSSERIHQAVHSNGPVLDDRILADPQIQEAIKNQVRGCGGRLSQIGQCWGQV